MKKSSPFESESLARVLQAGGVVSDEGNVVCIPLERISNIFAAISIRAIHAFLRGQRKAGIRTVRYFATSRTDNGDVLSNVSWMVSQLVECGELREEDRGQFIDMLCDMIVDIVPLVDARLGAVCSGGYSTREVLAPRTDLERKACSVLYRAISYLQTFPTGTLTDEGKQHFAKIYELAGNIPPILAGDRFHDSELDMILIELAYLIDIYGGEDYRARLVRPTRTWKESAYRWAGFGMVAFFIGVVVGRLM